MDFKIGDIIKLTYPPSDINIPRSFNGSFVGMVISTERFPTRGTIGISLMGSDPVLNWYWSEGYWNVYVDQVQPVKLHIQSDNKTNFKWAK